MVRLDGPENKKGIKNLQTFKRYAGAQYRYI